MPLKPIRAVIKKEGLVDLVGGTQTVKDWAMDLIETHYRNSKKGELMVLVLERVNEYDYNGELYITKEDFDRSDLYGGRK